MIPPDAQKPAKQTILPYYGLAAVCFVLVALLCIVAAPAFTGHYFQPKLLAITHLFILGWGTTMIFGASNQLMPVLTECKLYSEKIPQWVFILMVIGLPLLIIPFWHFHLTWTIFLGGAIIITAIALHAINIFKTANNIKNNTAAEFMLTAHVWLLLTVTIGYTLLVNFRIPFLSDDHLKYLRLHASIGMAGWFLQLVIGVSSKLIPMFLVSSHEDKRNMNITYYCLNLGLITFFIGGLSDSISLGNLAPALIISAGVISYAVYILQCYRKAIRKQLDTGMKQTFLALVFLTIPFILLLINILNTSDVSPRMITAYGFAFFAGFVSIIMMGQTFKTLPFIVWMHLNKPGQLPEKLPRDLYNENWVQWKMYLYALGYFLFLSGILSAYTWLIYAGGALLLVTAVWYCYHVFFIMNKLREK